MPGSSRKEEYSSATGLIFLFNLIVGTGALALPGALQNAGWILGVALLLALACFSLITVTFIVETLAVSNALSRKRYEETDEPETEDQVEETPLVPRPEGQENNVFEITEKYELGQMGVLVSPKWCQIIIYLCLCVYLYGDLAIYIVVIGRTGSNIICQYIPGNQTTHSVSDDTPCSKGSKLSRMDVYRLSVTVFILLMGPFIFFNLQKTKILQIITSCMRWLAFFIMIVWSIQKLVAYGRKGNPPYADMKALPTLFGTLVYSFMCQHSIPGLLQPIINKSHIKAIIGIDFALVSVFYITLSMTAIFTFKKVEDLYILNFWEDCRDPNTALFLVILAYYLALFPIFTLSTNFPIIGITLRNNLRNMILKDSQSKWYYDRLVFPIVTIIPPSILALAVSDVHLLVGVVGSYAGACVQYLIPCLLVHFARSQAQDFNGTNAYASPFKCKYWIIAVYVWMVISLILITINYATNLK